ncbi:mediator of RNA polymerase II transcription subunit [Trifolium medium]|uniref:Mediator of RNA polymerase II transcription subunit n=1 Tax=Trifolium medium TaxID=97028 RepID=A0A392QR11_9FABA|nr:mediator of RNA polymerase II transcription subunit [Trifolium medium]
MPPVVTRSAEHVNGQRGGGLNRGKLGSEENGRVLGHEEAAKLSQKVVARILLGAGFEAAMEGPIEYLSDVMSKRIVKIGTNLKVLTDSYKKQCSAIELLKMLLKTVGFRYV